MKKHPLPKDSLSKIIKIMENIEENDSKLTKDNFKDDDYHLFRRYCLEGRFAEAYAEENDTYKTLSLTQKGVRKLHELRQVLAEEKRNEQSKFTSMLIALGSVILALSAMINLFVNYPNQVYAQIISNVMFVFSGIVIAIVVRYGLNTDFFFKFIAIK